MIFKKMWIQNFGLFCGTHEFDLEPRVKYGKRRPIILFGGKNGAGKTTFLEAVLLCLYGKNALGNRVGTQDYLDYVAGRIHRPRGGGGVRLNEASIRLEFFYASFGELHLYTVERIWKRTDDHIEEQLSLLRDGNASEDFETEHVQNFLKDLIPIGVSQLFFFDGEKIQSLAEEEDGTALAEAVKAMLNLDIIEQLQLDLSIYETKKKKDSQTGEAEKHLKELEQTRIVQETQLADLRQDRAQVEAHLQRVTAKIEEVEAAFAADGGIYAQRREEFKSRRASLSTQIEQFEDRIREECARLFPFAFVPELCEQLDQQILRESEVQKWHIIEDLAETNWQKVRKQLDKKVLKETNLTAKEQKTLQEQIGVLFLDAFKPPENLENTFILHNFSQSDTQQVFDWIKRGVPASRQILGEMTRRLEKALEELRKVEMNLQRVPDDATLAPRIQELNELNQTLGSLHEKSEQLDREIRQLDFQLNEIHRQYKKELDELVLEEDLAHRLILIDSVQEVLTEYFEELSHAKVLKLEYAVAQCFSLICRKGDIVRRIGIDPKTFSVTLYNREGLAIPKKQLSAGEKQIYAISMLWALAQISGRPLPVIIDTPLGRLDSDHRRNLVESYFTKASHQVIILSTDTEIDHEYFQALSPEISHAYHLEYHPEKESSTASEDYFWKHRESSDEIEQDQTLCGSIRTA